MAYPSARRAADFCAAAVLVIAVTVVLGGELTAAFAFATLALAVLGVEREGEYAWAHRLALILMSLTLFQTAVGLYRGGMGPEIGLLLIFLTVALWLLPTQRRAVQRMASALLYAVGFAGFLVLLGYLFGVYPLRRLVFFTPMTMSSAVSLIFLSVAIALTRPDRGLTGLLLDAGLAGRTARLIMPSAVLVPVIGGWLRLEGQRMNLYGTESGVALMTVVTVVAMGTIIWIATSAVRRADKERAAAVRLLHVLATTDELTGLLNRRGFMQLGGVELDLARRRHVDVILFYIDLDGLKQINDTYGHAAGDEAIRLLGEILKRSFDANVIARMGGDEFCVLMTGTPEDERAVRERLARATEAENAVLDRPYRLSVSIGSVTSSPGGAVSIDELLNCADEDLYRQRRGRSERAASDLRSLDRFVFDPPLEAVMENIGLVQVIDLSEAGARVVAPRGGAVGQALRFHVVVPETGIGVTAKCRIAWQQEAEGNGIHIGLEITEGTGVREILARLCAARRASRIENPRAAVRLRLPEPLDASFSPSHSVRVTDISRYGMRIEHDLPVELEDVITLSVASVPSFEVTADVVWSAAGESGLRLTRGQEHMERLLASLVTAKSL